MIYKPEVKSAFFNRLKFPPLIFSFLLVINNTAFAAGGKVEALQMPAWLERNGQLQAVKPGMSLQSGDSLITGANARLLLRLDEGSLVKLGEDAKLSFDSLAPVKQQGLFEATLNVVKGAFRFTTTALGQTYRRKVDVRIGSITAGIRGTDIWGSSKIDKDILCLIEGKITVQRHGEAAFAMQDPLTFYLAPKNTPAPPVTPVPGAKLAIWAAETELQDGKGILSIDGQWSVNLMSVVDESSIKPILSLLTTAGYAAEIQHAIVRGKSWYRLRINGFKSSKDASAFAASIKGSYGISSSWIVGF